MLTAPAIPATNHTPGLTSILHHFLRTLARARGRGSNFRFRNQCSCTLVQLGYIPSMQLRSGTLPYVCHVTSLRSESRWLVQTHPPCARRHHPFSVRSRICQRCVRVHALVLVAPVLVRWSAGHCKQLEVCHCPTPHPSHSRAQAHLLLFLNALNHPLISPFVFANSPCNSTAAASYANAASRGSSKYPR